MIRYLVQMRRQVKSEMKRVRDEMQLKQLNIKQLALKILANSMYGCLGFQNSRFRACAIASTVTKTGRCILNNTRHLAEKAGYMVVYGDTDSIMINTGAKNYQDCVKVGNELKKEVNKQYKYLQIDIDYVFKKMLLLKKKKYAALKVVDVKQDEVETMVEVKGLDLVRRDRSIVSKNACKFVLDTLFLDCSRDDIRVKIGEYLTTLGSSMRNNALDVNQYVITKSLTHALKDYNSKNNGTNPHVVVASRMEASGQKMNISFRSTLVRSFTSRRRLHSLCDLCEY